MRRRKYSDQETDLLHKLKWENKSLKKEIGSLRKQLNRLDVDRFQNLKELIEAQEQKVEKQHEEQVAKKDWLCWDCNSGTLRLVLLERRDGMQYFRRCDKCDRRTKLQKYNDKVKGIK